MHAVSKDRLGIGTDIEVVVRGCTTQALFQRLDQLVPIDLEGFFVGPDFLNQFQPRIVTGRLHGQQATARAQTAGQRRQHVFDLEIGAHAGAPGLRSEHQVIIAARSLAAAWNHVIEQKAMVLAKHDQHRRTHVHRVARLFVGLDLPAGDQFIVDAAQLLAVLLCRIALQRHLDPVQRGRLVDVVRHQPG